MEPLGSEIFAQRVFLFDVPHSLLVGLFLDGMEVLSGGVFL